MFRPAIQKLSTLLLMATFCVAMAFISMHFKTTEYKRGYSYKVQAKQIMSNALLALKDEADIIYEDKEVQPQINDATLDPLKSGLIFYCDDSEGKLSSKLSTFLALNFSII